MLLFSREARKQGLTELIMPIYYSDVPELHEPPPLADPIIETIRKANWEDWRKLALEEPDSSMVRKAIDKLATDLLRRLHEADAKPANVTAPGLGTPEGDDGSADGSDDREDPDEGDGDGDGQGGGVEWTPDLPKQPDGDGVLEILAGGEEAMESLADDLNRLPEYLREMTDLATRAVDRVQKANEGPRPFAGRLTVAKQYASELNEVADRLEPLAQSIVHQFGMIDPMISIILTRLEAEAIESADRATADAFYEGLITMAEAVDGYSAQMEEMLAAMQQTASFSKDLRRPTDRIERAFLSIGDAQAVVGRWRDTAEELQSTVS